MHRRAAGLALAGLTAGALLAGCGGGASATAAHKPTTHTITVNFELNTGGDEAVNCSTGGAGGAYSDIGNSTDVTVYDGSGKVIATAPLGDNCEQAQLDGQPDYYDATWHAKVTDVPDVPFYQVEVGHRGKLTFSRSELAGKGWAVSASLGNN